jgi:hypothetical protein
MEDPMTLSEVPIAHAQTIALARLVRIVHESPDDHQARLAAEAILKLRPPEPAASDPVPARSAPPPRSPPRPEPVPADAPLTDDEIARLHRALPHVRPERFTRKHRPGHWRQVLAQLEQPPLQRTG